MGRFRGLLDALVFWGIGGDVWSFILPLLACAKKVEQWHCLGFPLVTKDEAKQLRAFNVEQRQ